MSETPGSQGEKDFYNSLLKLFSELPDFTHSKVTSLTQIISLKQLIFLGDWKEI